MTEIRTVHVIDRQRAVVVALRDGNDIDDTVLREMQTTLDLEEVGLTRLTITEPG